MPAKDLAQMLDLTKPWHVAALEMDPAARTVRLRGECAAAGARRVASAGRYHPDQHEVSVAGHPPEFEF